MKEYKINLNHYYCPMEFTLYHEKEFTKEELEQMMIQTVKEMRWNGIRRTFGNEKNYMMEHFGFWTK